MATRLVAPTEEAWARVVAAVRRMESTLRGHERERKRPPHGEKAFPFRNDAGETIPAYGAMRFASFEAKEFCPFAVVEKPSTTPSRDYLLNGPEEVEDGKTFGAQMGPEQRAIYDASGTPATGEMWGPKPGEFELFKYYPGFTVLGIVDATAKIALVRPEPILHLHGKTDAAIAKGASGTVSIWTGAPGSEVDSTINVTAYNRFANVAITKWVWLSYDAGWYLTAAEC